MVRGVCGRGVCGRGVVFGARRVRAQRGVWCAASVGDWPCASRAWSSAGPRPSGSCGLPVAACHARRVASSRRACESPAGPPPARRRRVGGEACERGEACGREAHERGGGQVCRQARGEQVGRRVGRSSQPGWARESVCTKRAEGPLVALPRGLLRPSSRRRSRRWRRALRP
eukprot:118094-Prymnesium_polylepis.1